MTKTIKNPPLKVEAFVEPYLMAIWGYITSSTQMKVLNWLVVWKIFSIYMGILIPTDFHIFQRGRSTTNQSRLYRTIWVNYNDLTVLTKPGIMVSKGNHLQMAERFRLVKY